jgi:hypothetical protein
MPKLLRYYGSQLRGKVEKQLVNKKSNPFGTTNANFFVAKKPS